ncbi:ATP-binding protein [Caballeronia sp. RCC_10]|uniref:hybrid sensor histidine kinase/response regulator n=1 Tax=Caballeronia sp. RCC_10 TaxID=3239227 RepID=UPI0035256F7F
MLSIDDSFEHAGCGLLSAHIDGTILRVNSTLCRWLGYGQHELVNVRKVSDILTVGAKLFQQTHWGPLLELQGSVAELKLELLGRERNRIPMLLNVRRVRSKDRDFDHYAFMVLTDRHRFEQELVEARARAERALEAQRQVKDQLRRADRQKDEFLATLAHELRNPLAPMRSVMDLLKTPSLDAGRVQWGYGVLDRQLNQLSHLVDDLLDVSRISAGKIELRRAPVNVAEAMQTALEASRPRITAASHHITVDAPPEPLTVDADPTRLSQIMQNLLNNAAKYTPPGGNIWFSAFREDGEAVIVVRDSGIGIDETDLPSLFGLFTQLSGGKQYAEGGLGVGLALVKMLTDLHGGTASARSPGIGQGSEFIVRLPLSTLPQSHSQRPPASSHKNRPRRILLVDDNRDAGESLSMLLELDGHTVLRADDAKSALLIARENELDVALLDIGLPDMSGYELAARIRESAQGSDLLFVAITGWGQKEDLAKAKAAGFDLHFTKPVHLDRLLAAIATRL